jgi:hypothetical protein
MQLFGKMNCHLVKCCYNIETYAFQIHVQSNTCSPISPCEEPPIQIERSHRLYLGTAAAWCQPGGNKPHALFDSAYWADSDWTMHRM